MTIFVECDGDILNDDADALVNPVNCVGVMGAGLAKQFAQRWPRMYDDYRNDCEDGGYTLGAIRLWEPDDGRGPVIVNLPTKDHWRDKSSIAAVGAGLLALRDSILLRKMIGYPIKTIAIPALGCGLGGLRWPDVESAIRDELHGLDIEVHLYPPQGDSGVK